MRIDDPLKVWGYAASVVVHGALLGALMFHPAPRTGIVGASERGIIVFDVRAISADQQTGSEPTTDQISAKAVARPGSSTAANERQYRAITGDALVERPATAGVGDAQPGESRDAQSAGASQAVHDLQTAYQAELFAHVLKYRYYPDEARPERLQGIVRIQFAMTRDGRVMSAWVQQGSGYRQLDEAALEAIRRAQPLPPIPKGLPDEMEVVLPLDFISPRVQLGTG